MSEGKLIPKESERRQATVMFADLSGFTAMSEKIRAIALKIGS